MLRFRVLIALSCLSFGCAVADNAVDGVIVHKDGGTGDAHDTGAHLDDTGGSDFDSGAASDSSSRFDTSSDDTGSGFDTGTIDDTGTGGTCTPAPKSMCTTGAVTMTSVSGDTGSDVSNASGSDGEWLRINVTENDSSIFSSKDLHVRLTLTSPPGENFDLYVYEGPLAGDGGGIECTTVAGSSTTSGVDVVNLTWPDEHPIGGHDDSRELSVEVRPAAGSSCSSSAKWTLMVQGDT